MLIEEGILKFIKYNENFEVAGIRIPSGQRVSVDVPIGQLPTQTKVAMRAEVIHGTKPGPVIWISSAIHGDELNGVEITRQVLRRLKPEGLKGIVIAVPVVNVYGFNQESRYLPDRRDLNRSFPGAKRGSMASRLANKFMQEIVLKCDLGIDLHTASQGRHNLPQLRGDKKDTFMLEIAHVFGAPIFVHSKPPTRSLRDACRKLEIPVVLYEAGEAERFDPASIELGKVGILRVLKMLNMIERAPIASSVKLRIATGTKWVRASRSGLLRLDKVTGDFVHKKQKLGVIGDAFGDRVVRVNSPQEGLIISHATKPLLNQGDPVVHIATLDPE